MAQHPCRPAQYLQYMRRMYDRHDALCDACDHVRWAAESLRQCRDVALSEDIAALEQIGDQVARERDATHARLEQFQAREMRELARESTD